MGVVTKYGPSYPLATQIAHAAKAEGRLKAVFMSLVIANGDSATSVWYLGKVPSSGIILPHLCNLAHATIAGVSSLSFGLGGDGLTTAPAVLASALDLTSGSSKNPAAAVTTANVGKAFWELFGASRDPNRKYDIIATLGNDASAAGTPQGFIVYADF